VAFQAGPLLQRSGSVFAIQVNMPGREHHVRARVAWHAILPQPDVSSPMKTPPVGGVLRDLIQIRLALAASATMLTPLVTVLLAVLAGLLLLLAGPLLAAALLLAGLLLSALMLLTGPLLAALLRVVRVLL
jgi:hypothetical protein